MPVHVGVNHRAKNPSFAFAPQTHCLRAVIEVPLRRNGDAFAPQSHHGKIRFYPTQINIDTIITILGKL